MPYNERGYMKRRHDQIAGNLEKAQGYLADLCEYSEESLPEVYHQYLSISDSLSDLVTQIRKLKGQI